MNSAEKAIVESFAGRMLGQSNVASITSETLRKRGENVEMLAALILKYRTLHPKDQQFEIKRIQGEPESLKEFGLIVRRRL